MHKLSLSARDSAPHRAVSRPRGSLWVRLALLILLVGLPLLLTACSGRTEGLPTVRVQLGPADGETAAPGVDGLSVGVQLLVLLTVLSLVPAVLMMLTSFIRIAVVLSFARSAIGMQQMPPNQILLGLALFLTIFVMAPVWGRVNDVAVQPYLQGEIAIDEAVSLGSKPLREFMFKQTRERDIALFMNLSKLPQPETRDDVPSYALIPAFMISELKTSFQMGFIILLPFVVIDMVISSALMSMGMMMLPPTTISLPFKVLLFVMVDGWHLIVKSLITSFV